MTQYGFESDVRGWLSVGAGVLQKLDGSDSPLALWNFEGDLLDASGNGRHLSTGAGAEKWCRFGDLTGLYSDTSHYVYSASAALALTGAMSLIMLCVHQTALGSSHVHANWTSANDTAEADNSLYSLATVAASNGLVYSHEHGIGVDDSLALRVYQATYVLHAIGFTRTATGLVRVFIDGRRINEQELPLPTGGANGRLALAANITAATRYAMQLYSVGVYGTALSDARMTTKMGAMLGVVGA